MAGDGAEGDRSASPSPVSAPTVPAADTTTPCPNCDGRCWWRWSGDQAVWCKRCHPGLRAVVDEAGVIREKHWIGCHCRVCALIDPPVADECRCGECQPLVALQTAALAEHSR